MGQGESEEQGCEDTLHPRVRIYCSRFCGAGWRVGVSLCTGRAEGAKNPPVLTGPLCASPSPSGADMGPWVSTGFISPH